jgi:hypothetical protein
MREVTRVVNARDVPDPLRLDAHVPAWVRECLCRCWVGDGDGRRGRCGRCGALARHILESGKRRRGKPQNCGEPANIAQPQPLFSSSRLSRSISLGWQLSSGMPGQG